jgi:hypothetical protein
MHRVTQFGYSRKLFIGDLPAHRENAALLDLPVELAKTTWSTPE